MIDMILHGPSIKKELDENKLGKAAAVTRESKSSTSQVRHNRDKESPLPIYTALKIHAETRK